VSTVVVDDLLQDVIVVVSGESHVLSRLHQSVAKRRRNWTVRRHRHTCAGTNKGQLACSYFIPLHASNTMFCAQESSPVQQFLHSEGA